jgi:hypothetical protein
MADQEDDGTVEVTTSKKDTHIIGYCCGCKTSHNGLLTICVRNGAIELGVSGPDDEFHPIERLRLIDIVLEDLRSKGVI